MKIIFKLDAIQNKTDKSYLIQIPDTSWQFWHPKSMVSFPVKNKMVVWIPNDAWELKFRCDPKSGEMRGDSNYIWNMYPTKAIEVFALDLQRDE